MLVICGAEPEMSISSAFMKVPGGGLDIFTDRDQRSIFLGFEFQESAFFWVLLTVAVFFGLLDKCCIFKCSIFLTVFFGVQFYAPGTSVITVLHYYRIVLNFCNEQGFWRVLFRVLLFGKYFMGCSVSGKVFFGGTSKIPNFADPCL